jgi:hypothetical protein
MSTERTVLNESAEDKKTLKPPPKRLEIFFPNLHGRRAPLRARKQPPPTRNFETQEQLLLPRRTEFPERFCVSSKPQPLPSPSCTPMPSDRPPVAYSDTLDEALDLQPLFRHTAACPLAPNA